MTHDEIDKLEGGPELDALVAEKVTGWKCDARDCDGVRLTRCGACGREGHGNCYGPGLGGEIQVSCADRGHRPNYSGDIAAAWEVVEKTGLLNDLDLTWGTPREGGEPAWRVKRDRCGDEEDDIATAATAPLAICRAALKVLSS